MVMVMMITKVTVRGDGLYDSSCGYDGSIVVWVMELRGGVCVHPTAGWLRMVPHKFVCDDGRRRAM